MDGGPTQPSPTIGQCLMAGSKGLDLLGGGDLPSCRATCRYRHRQPVQVLAAPTTRDPGQWLGQSRARQADIWIIRDVTKRTRRERIPL